MARVVTWVFYRVDCAGPAPPPGAVLILPNHPNALLDPAVVWATSGRHIRFLAKSTLFEGPLKPLLVAAGAIPVYRRIDQGADTSQNARTFAAVAAALAGGEAVCLFPEGVSHSTGRLQPLRTGAARMALAAEAGGTRVAIVPAGLNFDRKTVFRSRVTVIYGEPFSCADLAGACGAEDREVVRAATDRIAANLRRLLVEADPDAETRLIDRVERLYSAARGSAVTPQERVARKQVIAAGIERLRAAEPDRYGELLLRFRRYDERLRRFGLRDRHLDWRVSTGDALWFAARELVIALVLGPLCLAGLVLFAVPYHVTALLSRRVAGEPEIVATAQVLGGALVYAAWLALIGAVGWWFVGAREAAAAVVVAIAIAGAGLLAVERESAVLEAIRAYFLLRRTRTNTRERLRRHRSDLADLLDEVYSWLSTEPAGAAR
jgi:1-acyl-sn-glycerol-3-phosphate acyltransferase